MMFSIAQNDDLGSQVMNAGGVPIYISTKKEIPTKIKSTLSIMEKDIPEKITKPIKWNCNVRSSYFKTKMSLGGNETDIERMVKESEPLSEYLSVDVLAFLEYLNFDSQNFVWGFELWWSQKYGNGEYQEIHNHLSHPLDDMKTILSVIYLPYKNDSHSLCINLQEGINLHSSYFLPVNENNSANAFALGSPHHLNSLEDNTVIIFPSYVNHSVKWVNPSKKDRVSFSSNVVIQKKTEVIDPHKKVIEPHRRTKYGWS